MFFWKWWTFRNRICLELRGLEHPTFGYSLLKHNSHLDSGMMNDAIPLVCFHTRGWTHISFTARFTPYYIVSCDIAWSLETIANSPYFRWRNKRNGGFSLLIYSEDSIAFFNPNKVLAECYTQQKINESMNNAHKQSNVWQSINQPPVPDTGNWLRLCSETVCVVTEGIQVVHVRGNIIFVSLKEIYKYDYIFKSCKLNDA